MKHYNEIADSIINGLEQYSGLYIENDYLNFADNVNKTKQLLEETSKEGRLLKIGIIGEVKAGKSSFLNCLLFNGEDFLPKAATPMTAALTKISYSEKKEATVVYYTHEDWNIIEKKSCEYDKIFNEKYYQYVKSVSDMQISNTNIHYMPVLTKEQKRPEFESQMPADIKACKELTSKASETLLYKLGTEDKLDESLADKNGLENYVGPNGEYTPIVKHIKLGINDENLKGYEIVDTPGMNDPIESRVKVTKDYLAECDVVFLLSPLSQFLKSDDIALMSKTLPSKSINNIFIVGTKFDSCLLETNGGNFLPCFRSVVGKFNDYFFRRINELHKNNPGYGAFEKLKKSNKCLYTSSVLYSVSAKRKRGEELNEAEKHVLKNLNRIYKDFDEGTIGELSGFPDVTKCLQNDVLKNKLEIIQKKNSDIVKKSKTELLSYLDNMTQSSYYNKKMLEESSRDELEAIKKSQNEKIDSSRTKIRDAFNESIDDTRIGIQQIKINLNKEIRNYRAIKITTEQNGRAIETRHGLFGILKNVDYVPVDRADVSSVTDNLSDYVARCQEFASTELLKVIEVERLTKKLLNIIADSSDRNINTYKENSLRYYVEETLRKLRIPEFKVNSENHIKKVTKRFGTGKVMDDDVASLKHYLSVQLEEINHAFDNELDLICNKIVDMLTDTSVEFSEEIKEKFTVSINNLIEQIESKEENLKRYSEFEEKTKEFRKLIKETEF